MAEHTHSTDCLVLKLEDNNEHNNLSRHVIYVLYDVESHCYVVRGLNIQNGWAKKYPDDCPYSFISKDTNSLADFILQVISKHCTVKEVLYNYDNLPELSSEITYDFLKNNELEDYEISYNPQKCLHKKSLLSTLKILKNVFNYYK
jgi:hypothetical protein